MNLSATSRPGEASVSAYSNSQGLTGESLIVYLSTKLTDVDGTLDNFMQGQQEALVKKEQLQKYREMLLNLKNAKDSSAERQRIYSDYAAYVAQLPPGSVALKAGQEALNHYATEVSGQSASDDYIDVDIKHVEAQIGDVDKDMELMMIRINQLMSQRQTAIQLVTNIMNKFNEGLSTIVQSLRS